VTELDRIFHSANVARVVLAIALCVVIAGMVIAARDPKREAWFHWGIVIAGALLACVALLGVPV
jgi:hypothetical protein